MKKIHVKCRSGLMGEQYRLQDSYDNFEHFQAYAEMYGIHIRLRYKTPATAWRANPLIQSSVEPRDLCKVMKNGRRIFAREQ